MIDISKMVDKYLDKLSEQDSVEPVGYEEKTVPKCPDGYHW